jgi:colicin import membrane protein
MRETRADTRQALLQALALHVLLFAAMFAGLRWTRAQVAAPAAGEVIEADLVDPSALSAPMQRALQREPEQPAEPPPPAEPEPPLPAPLPPPVPDPAPVEQPAVQRDAPSPDVAKVPREQDARRKPPPQADLDAQRQAAAERERQRKLAEVSRQLAQARRERTQAEMRAQQLEDARAHQPVDMSRAAPPPGNRGPDQSLLAQYKAALQQAIARRWTRPESVPLGQPCKVAIRQLPGGDVVSAVAEPSCPYDELGRRSVETAVLKASPLPYAGFEDVFARTITFNFQAEDR